MPIIGAGLTAVAAATVWYFMPPERCFLKSSVIERLAANPSDAPPTVSVWERLDKGAIGRIDCNERGMPESARGTFLAVLAELRSAQNQAQNTRPPYLDATKGALALIKRLECAAREPNSAHDSTLAQAAALGLTDVVRLSYFSGPSFEIVAAQAYRALLKLPDAAIPSRSAETFAALPNLQQRLRMDRRRAIDAVIVLYGACSHNRGCLYDPNIVVQEVAAYYADIKRHCACKEQQTPECRTALEGRPIHNPSRVRRLLSTPRQRQVWLSENMGRALSGLTGDGPPDVRVNKCAQLERLRSQWLARLQFVSSSSEGR